MITLKGINIKYTLDPEKQEIKFEISGTSKNWIGIGFGKGMDNVDMVSMTYVNNVVKVEDRWATGEFMPKLDAAHGCTSTLVTLDSKNTYDPNTNAWQISFTKPFVGNSCNQTFKDNMSMDLSVALGTDIDKFTNHSTIGQVKVTLTSAAAAAITSNFLLQFSLALLGFLLYII